MRSISIYPVSLMARAVLVMITVITPAATAVAADYKPAICAIALPYAGRPIYQEQAVLPSAELKLGAVFDTLTSERLDTAAMQAMQFTKAHGMTAAVGSQEGMWQTTKVVGNATAPMRFYWASAGKALTATVVMQLVEEGKLSLDRPISRWIADFPNNDAITIDHLLTHTAGVFSANEDLVVRKTPRYRSSDESIAIAKRHGPMFCPGQQWRYSNTGYEMLGKIIEEVEGKPYGEVIKLRIAGPLHLTTLRALAPAEIPADVAELAPTRSDDPAMSPSWGNAAGNVVSSAADMVTFWHALLTAKLLNKENTMKLFEHLYPMFDNGTFYGRGVMLYSFVDQGVTTTWLGHSGGASGVKAVVTFSPAKNAFVAVALTGDGSAEATANLLFKQLLQPVLSTTNR